MTILNVSLLFTFLIMPCIVLGIIGAAIEDNYNLPRLSITTASCFVYGFIHGAFIAPWVKRKYLNR